MNLLNKNRIGFPLKAVYNYLLLSKILRRFCEAFLRKIFVVIIIIIVYIFNYLFICNLYGIT